MLNTIYIGASNRHYGLTQYTVYKERPEELIQTLKGKFPLIERLFVSVIDFVELDKDLKKPETVIYKAWKETKEGK